MSKIYDRLTCCDLYDSDTDGLPDVFETAGMKLPTGEIIFTETDKPDSDDDGLLDGEEIDYTINDGYVKFKLVSDPTLADSDGDGLDDPVEKEIGTYPYSIDTDGDDIDDEEEYFLGLNPIKSDTDGDCLNDGLEFFIGLDSIRCIKIQMAMHLMIYKSIALILIRIHTRELLTKKSAALLMA